MRILIVAFALITLPVSAMANDPAIFVLINAEKASGFQTLAECERALGVPDQPRDKVSDDKKRDLRGSRFNRNAGNISRCEMVDGEALIVVYPKGYTEKAPSR